MENYCEKKALPGFGQLFQTIRSNLYICSMKCDAPVTAFWLEMMYTHGVGRKRDDGNRKEYTISEVAYQLGCDSDTRTKLERENNVRSAI